VRLITLFVGGHTVTAPAREGASSEVQRFLLEAKATGAIELVEANEEGGT